MRRRLFNGALLISLVATAAAAQQFTRVWLRIAPEGEEFAVHMPEPNFRIRRELPFGGGVMLKPASFEVTQRGALLSVLSFAKSEPAAPKSLDAFVKGFQHALGQSTAGKRAVLEFEKEVKLDGHDGRQFRVNVGDASGSARIFETEKHFYVVLTYGGTEGADLAEHFHNSFTLDPAAADRVALSEPAERMLSPAQPPELLWPVAGGSGSIGVLAAGKGDGDTQPVPDISKADASKPVGRMIVSGGVLNGKAIAKPKPVYPPIAKAARAQGVVTVQIIIDEEGYVIAAHAVSGHPLLQEAAVFAARQARFTPTRLGGQPVKVSGVVTYNFVLV
ncbi:MAG: TonB family protein [Pyrinomonadaceae bacterium]